jgi:hypothetical protein
LAPAAAKETMYKKCPKSDAGAGTADKQQETLYFHLETFLK